MKIIAWLALSLSVLAWQTGAAGDISAFWAYHDDDDFIDDRATEQVPGDTLTFVGNGKTQVPNDEPVTLYVVTVNNFAGDADEKVVARWWNGQQENWLEGSWVKNIAPDAATAAELSFHGQTITPDTKLDLWKIEVPADMTQPGDNFYFFQLKAQRPDGSAGTVVLLLADSSGETSQRNNLGQAWTENGDYYTHDWAVTILP